MVHDFQPTIYVGRSTGEEEFWRRSDSATVKHRFTPLSSARDEWFGPARRREEICAWLPNKYDDSVQMLKLA